MATNVRILTGDCLFQIKERIDVFRTAFAKKYPEGDISEIYAGADAVDMKNALATESLFSTKRIIFFFDCINADNLEQLIPQIELLHGNEDKTLIITLPRPDKRTKTYKTFIKGSFFVEDFPQLDGINLSSWCVKKSEKQMDTATANALIAYCGTDLWKLSTEIEKLVMSEKIITKELIHEMAIPSPSAEIWGMMEAFSAQNKGRAMSEYGKLRAAGHEPFYVMAMLMRELRILLQLQTAKAFQVPTKSFGINRFVAKKTSPHASKWNSARLRKAFARLQEIDTGIKTGGLQIPTGDAAELDLALETFMISVCQ